MSKDNVEILIEINEVIAAAETVEKEIGSYLLPEIIWSALCYVQENPKVDIDKAMWHGFYEWIK